MTLLAYCRAHPWTWAVAAALGGGVCGAAGGYWLGPTKWEERSRVEYEIKEVEKIVEKVVRVEGPVRIVTKTREVPIPGSCDATGHAQTVTETEVIEDRGPVTVTTDEVKDRSLDELGVSATEKIVTRDAPRLTLGLTGGMPFKGGTFDVGVLVLGRVAGPFVVGGQVEVPITGNVLDGSARLVLGLTF